MRLAAYIVGTELQEVLSVALKGGIDYLCLGVESEDLTAMVYKYSFGTHTHVGELGSKKILWRVLFGPTHLSYPRLAASILRLVLRIS